MQNDPLPLPIKHGRVDILSNTGIQKATLDFLIETKKFHERLFRSKYQ